VRFTAAGSTSRTCSSTTGSLVFVKTKNRVAIFFPGGDLRGHVGVPDA
jgi:hypothetical protein